MKKTLIVSLARLGDILQSIPMVMGLREQDPDSRIALLVNSNFADACLIMPAIDTYFEIDFGHVWTSMLGSGGRLEESYAYLKAIFDRIRAEGFTEIINLTPHHIGIYAAFLAGNAAVLNGTAGTWQTYHSAVTRRWRTLPYHIADLYLKMAGLKPQRHLPAVRADSVAQKYANEFLLKHDIRPEQVVVGMQPGASTREKQWPIEYFIELGRSLVEGLGVRLILFGADSDKELGAMFEKSLGTAVINAIGRTRMNELAALLLHTRILVTNDTGPMHVATACGTKVISIHMGIEKCFTTGPYGEGHLALQPRIACHPCERASECPSRACRTMIRPKLIYKLISAILSASAQPEYGLSCNDLLDAEVFVSGFDAFGGLDFFPVFKFPLSFKALAPKLVRLMWDRCLSRDIDADTSSAQIMQDVQRLEHECVCHYDIRDLSEIERQWKIVDESLKSINDAAQLAVGLCDEIASLAEGGLHHTRKMQGITKQLEQADDVIISLGEIAEQTSAIVNMFLFERQLIDGDNVVQMARQSLQLYSDVQKRCKVFTQLGSNVIELLKNRQLT